MDLIGTRLMCKQGSASISEMRIESPVLTLHRLALLTGVALTLFISHVAVAEESGALNVGEVTSLSAGYLVKLFVLAVIVENGLAVLFNWRVFLTYFSLRGFRTLITVGVSWLIVSTFDVNIVRELLQTYSGKQAEAYFGAGLLTALVIAGGSSGVHNIMRALGYRDLAREPQLATSPGKSAAWISVTVRKDKLKSPALIQIHKENSSVTGPATAGMCHGNGTSIKQLFFPSNDRFPKTGGYELEPGVAYSIMIQGTDDKGQELSVNVTETPITLAPGAVLDLEVSV